MEEFYLWDLWIADVASTGISFARGRTQPATTLLVHAAPQQLNIEVRSNTGNLIAHGEDLLRTATTPIARLRIQGQNITRQDIWPTQDDWGTLVILPGGEVGTLQQWWNTEDHQQWRWSIELYNHR
jgi:hypothetical protein